MNNLPYYDDIADLKQAQVSIVAAAYDKAIFTWTTGDYGGRADDENVIKSDHVPINEGAWVRQGADKIRTTSGRSVQQTLDAISANSTMDLYTNEATGSDTAGTGASGNPFATVQKAIDSVALLTSRSTIRIIATGDVTTSSRPAVSMDRPALIYIDGIKIGRRTAQRGNGLRGGLVLDLTDATVKPDSIYKRGIYCTGHSGSVGIVGGSIVAQPGAESLIVAHRGCYVHVRDTVGDGNGIAALGLLAEAGGFIEAIDVSVTGCTTDVHAYSGCGVQVAAPGGSSSVGSIGISAGGSVSLVMGVTVTGTIISRGGQFDLVGTALLPVRIAGNYDGQAGTVTGSYVLFTNSESAIIPVGEQWKIDSLHSAAQLNFRGGVATLNGFQSFVAPAIQSTHAHPIRCIDGAKVTFSNSMNTKANNGDVRSPDLMAANVNVSADGQVIPISPNGQTHHLIRLSNTKGSIATGCSLSRELAAYLTGTLVGNGQIVTLFNTGTGIEIVNGTTMTALNGGAIILGSSSGQTRSITLAYHSNVAQWVPVSFGQVVP